MQRQRKLIPALALAGLATGLSAQEAVLVGGRVVVQRGQGDPIDDGVAVEMFESPNLDRFLRRARQFLDEEKFPEAIQVLQSVIEGRTLVATTPGADDGVADGAGAPEGPEEPAPAGAGEGDAEDGRRLADPAQNVFSQDGRIYRPARRLCHEYLALMPPIGLELYRTRYEATAREQLDAALRSGLTSEIELVANNYFVTLAAGEAMQVLADRHMHEARYRAAVQVLRDLSELYPEVLLARLGISRLWCRFKIALCLRLAGEASAALDAARELGEDYPDESLRIMGELQPIASLDESPYFAAEDQSLVADVGADRGSRRSWLGAETSDLVPLWQYRFHGDTPYAAVRRSDDNSRNVFFGMEGVVINAAPHASRYGTGTQVAFLGAGYPAPRAVFLEHYRLRVADAFTGLLRLEGDGVIEPPRPLEGRPRARVPAYDFALQRPVADGERYYVITGYSKSSQSLDALKTNRIVAYDADSCRRLWCSDDFLEGDDSYRDVTFLSSPTVFGERLLTPVLRRGAYMLQCSDRQTGKPLWRTRIHAGGSKFYKAPGTPVLVAGSLAYVLTNAGAVAAVDAFAGDLKWIRKYERSDPLRPRPVVRSAQQRGRNVFRRGGQQFREDDLPHFLPSEMFTAAGTVVFAGCDSRMLLCVDGASGEPLWMIDGTTNYAPYGDLRYVVGTNSEHLYAASESDLVCIGLRSGLVRWHLPLPQASDRLTRWRGRGCVLEDFVLMPGDREVLVVDADGQGGWRRIQLPSFGVGEEPLRGPNNLYCDGPWLGIAYPDGIECYSTADMLRSLAAEAATPMREATYLVQAGLLQEGIDTLVRWLSPADDGGPGAPESQQQRQLGEEQLVALARELALEQGEGGIAALDAVEPYVRTRPARLQWHLARLEVYQQVQDLTAYAREQQRLYRYMEGKD